MKQTDPFLAAFQEWISVFMRNSLHNAVRYSRDSGWSMSQLSTLMIIYKKGPCAVSDIGDALGVSYPAVSQMLDRLVQEELIFRTEDPDDRRVKQIKLTDKGQQKLKDNLHAHHAWLKDLAEDLSQSEKEQISKALNILIEKTKKSEQRSNSEHESNANS